MKAQTSVLHGDFDDPLAGVEEFKETSEADLWLSRLVPDFN